MSSQSIKQLLADIYDVTDPDCKDKILDYLELQKDGDHLFMEKLVDQLQGKEIYWKQPWYQKKLALTRAMKKSEVEEAILAGKASFRTDVMSTSEIEVMVQNWEDLVNEYKIPNTPICLARWRNKKMCKLPHTPMESVRRFVFAYLSRNLNRTVHQVFSQFVVHYSQPRQGHYTEEEKKAFEICMTYFPENCVEYLTLILHRHPSGIYKYLNAINNAPLEKKRTKWDLKLASKLVKLLIQHTGEPFENLKNKEIDISVWKRIEEEMELHNIYLKKFWYGKLHVQLFADCKIKTTYVKKKIIKILQSSNYKVWTDIRWKEVVKRFPDGFTPLFLMNTAIRAFQRQSNYLKRPLHELLESVSISHGKQRRLKNLRFDEETGKLNYCENTTRLILNTSEEE